jgi:hypothetical protein
MFRCAAVVVLLVSLALCVGAEEARQMPTIKSEFRLRRAPRHRVAQDPTDLIETTFNATGGKNHGPVFHRLRFFASDYDPRDFAFSGVFGIDISGDTCDGSAWVSDKQFPCFKGKGVTHAIIESHNGGLGNTKAIAHCTKAAHDASYARGMRAVALSSRPNFV